MNRPAACRLRRLAKRRRDARFRQLPVQLLGRQSGPRIFRRPKSRFFNPEHLKKTRTFYRKYGARAIVYARFIPIIRTCTPFISGVAEMPYLRFLFFSLFGGTLWIAFMMTILAKYGVPNVKMHMMMYQTLAPAGSCLFTVGGLFITRSPFKLWP